MVFMEWTDELSVGSSKIDVQHKMLIAYINRLDEAINKHQGDQVLKDIFDGLMNYTLLHFDLEERLLVLCDYPDLAAHQAEHRSLKESVLGFKEQFESGALNVDAKVLDFLKAWLVDHIMLTDKKYEAHLRSFPV